MSNSNHTICRFAPSPTGYLHVGNIRAAIINYLYAKKTGGKFLLRFDDTDVERTKDEYKSGIIKDMSWLGLEYDDFFKQSERLKIYEEAKNYLIQTGRLYECYESESELSLQRKTQIASGQTPVYNRASLNLTQEQKENYQKQGIKPYYRFLLEDKVVAWEDKIKGKISYNGRHFSDPVLFRENNVPTYTFCSVVDDILLKITDIIRGEDHITNTAIQIQIFESLQGLYQNTKIPDFSHLALVKVKDGKISKRIGGFDIRSLRNDGFEQLSLINLLAQIGTSKSIEVYNNIDDLVKNFDLSNYSKSATNYDIVEVVNINKKLLQILDFKYVIQRFKELEIADEISEEFWNLIKPNISFVSEIAEWLEIVKSGFFYPNNEKDAEFLALAAKLLPENTKSENSWNIWLEEIKKNSDRKGKELFMPLRLALTGKENGPELKYFIKFIERSDILKRLAVSK